MGTTYSSLENWQTSLKKRWADYSQKITDSLVIKKQRDHLLVLDGLRAAACLAVVLHHIIYQIALPQHWSGLWNPRGKVQVILAALLTSGSAGVILFFLLSSFLLFLPFANALLFDGQWPSLSRFYIRRFFRIVPGYYAAIILMVLFFHPELLQAAHRGILLEFFTFSMGTNVPDLLNGPFWTMAVEFQFYMLLPLIAWVFSLIVRRGTLRWRITKLIACLLVMLGWGLLARWWGLFISPSAIGFPQNILAALHPYYYGDNGKYFEAFAVGMLLALLYVYIQNSPKGETLRRKLQHWSPWMFLAGLFIVCFLAIYIFVTYDTHYGAGTAFPFLNPYRTMLDQIYSEWQSIGYALGYGLCMCALLYNTGQIKRPFEWPVLRWIGLFSYSLYMWHLPLLFVFMNIMNTQFKGVAHSVEFIALFAWVFFVIFPVSLTLYRWIEMPGMRLGEMLAQKIGKQKKAQPIDASRNAPGDKTASAPRPLETAHISTSADIS